METEIEKYKKYYDICQQYRFNSRILLRYCANNRIYMDDFKDSVKRYMRLILKRRFSDLRTHEVTFFFSEDIAKIVNNYRALLHEMINVDSQYETRLWNQESITKVMIEYVFNCFFYLGFDKEEITEKCLVWNIDYEKTCTLVARYALNIRKWSKEKVEAIFKDLINKTCDTIPSIMGKIMYAKSQDEVNEILDNTVQNYNQIEKSIPAFVLKLPIKNPEVVKRNLGLKLVNYKKYLLFKEFKKEVSNNEPKKSSSTPKTMEDKAIQTIRSYIDGNYYFEKEFLEKNRMRPKSFHSYLSYVKQNDEKLYEEYLTHQRESQDKRYIALVLKAQNIIDGIKNGVKINDKMRKFDLLDYFEQLNMVSNDFLKLVYESNLFPDYEIVRSFFNQYGTIHPLTPSGVRTLLKETTWIGVLFDENGEKIPGTGRILKQEEKQNLINYLAEKNILYLELYDILLQRYLKGEITFYNEIDNNKQKKLTK